MFRQAGSRYVASLNYVELPSFTCLPVVSWDPLATSLRFSGRISKGQLLRARYPITSPYILVLQNDQSRINYHSQDTHARHSHTYRIAQVVEVRHILSLKTERRHYATRITKSNHPRAADASLLMSILIHEVPTDDDGTGGEAAHGDETYAQVLRVEVVVDGQ